MLCYIYSVVHVGGKNTIDCLLRNGEGAGGCGGVVGFYIKSYRLVLCPFGLSFLRLSDD